LETLHVGFDDFDAPSGGCTTHLASLIIERLKDKVRFLDYPRLIRLNPNIPWKTRGNGAIALKLKVDDADKVKDIIIEVASKYNDEFKNSHGQPVLIFYEGEVSKELTTYGFKTVRDAITLDLALKVLLKVKAEAIRFNVGFRGVIGALAAIGITLEDTDYTYELITYRRRDYWGKPRRFNVESVKRLDSLLEDETFLNYDHEVGKPLIFPRGPDPVLYGVRGESAEAVIKALDIVEVYEPIDRWVVYRTNQATDMHLVMKSINQVRPYQSVIIKGKVTSHVHFKVTDDTGTLDVMVYEPTGRLAKKARLLMIGDLVEVYGGIRPASSKHPLTLNLERLKVVRLVEAYEYKNPKCPKCGATMTSAGRGKGFKCRKCGFRSSSLEKVKVLKSRPPLEPIITPSLRAYKHLMKPLKRFGKEKSKPPKTMIGKWYGVCS